MNKLELENLLKEAQNTYYNNIPIMTDKEYDSLLEELRELDSTSPILKTIGYFPTSPLQKYAHKIPMGSLNKVNSKEEFIKWAEKCGSKFILEPKFDGISVSLQFKNGKLIQALGRGDGNIGEDVTHNIRKCVDDLSQPFTGYLRGEVVIEKEIFEEHFADTMANPRNAASGVTRRLDGEGAEHLTVLVYDILSDEEEFTTEKEKVQRIKELGFFVDDYPLVGIDNAIRWYDYYTKGLRGKLTYEIDGLVIKMNDLEAQQALGEVDGRPRGQVAWKFAPEMKRTTLRDILWQVGNGGRVTPVAVFDVVKIGGSSITRASLHNAKRVQELRPFKGCSILVSKRGDVIPYVEEVLDD